MKISPILKKVKYSKAKGFSLVGLAIAIAVLGIIITIVIPVHRSLTEKTNEVVCNANRLQLERTYNIHLMTENVNDTSNEFEEFKNQIRLICPDEGEISRANGSVKCEIHSGYNEDEDEDDEDVPFLYVYDVRL